MKVLVTGGAGFIGSALVRELESRGHIVVVYDALTYAGNVDNLAGTAAGAALVRGDICDRPAILHALEQSVDAVAHLAADSHVQRSFGDFQRFIRVNVGGTEVVLDACASAPVRNITHVSTDEVFGYTVHGSWAYENTALRPRNPYAASKAAAEMVVRGYKEFRGLEAKVVRLSNCYGPRQHVEKLIPRSIARAAAGLPVEVHGDGTQVRDWLFVEDAARGIAEVIERGLPAGTYHLPGGSEHAVLNVVAAILEQIGRGQVGMVPDRPGGNDRRYGMARSELDWHPLMPFHAGLAATVQWYLEHPERLELAAIEASA